MPANWALAVATVTSGYPQRLVSAVSGFSLTVVWIYQLLHSNVFPPERMHQREGETQNKTQSVLLTSDIVPCHLHFSLLGGRKCLDVTHTHK